MARIRTIKPEFWSSPTIGRVSRDARLLFLGLLNEADDEGRMVYEVKRLAGVLFGFDLAIGPKTIAKWVAQLERVGLVVVYKSEDGGQYLWIVGFREHQRVSHPYPSKLPPPPFTERSVNVPGTTADLSENVQHRNGMEWNGMEEEGNGTRVLGGTSAESSPGTQGQERQRALPSLPTDEQVFELLSELWGPPEPHDRAGLYATVTLELLAMNATLDEITIRSSECRRRYPVGSPKALANHWHELGATQAPGWMTGIHQAVTDVEAS